MSYREANITLELTRPNGTVETISRFEGYRLNDSLFGASHFGLELPPTRANRALTKECPGWKFQLFANGCSQFSGIVDDRSTDTNTSATDLGIEGRDFRGLLMDSMIPADRLSLYNRTLAELATRWTVELWPEYITSVVTNNAANRFVAAGGAKTKQPSAKLIGPPTGLMTFILPSKAKSTYKPFGKNSKFYAGTGNERIEQNKLQFGETIWTALTDLSAQIGAHCWTASDGSLIISRPDYTFDPSAYGEGIRLLWDFQNKNSAGGNVQGVRYHTSLQGRWSEYKVTGLGKSKKSSRARGLLLDGGIIKDPGPAFWEPLTRPPWLGSGRLYKPGKIDGKGNLQSLTRLTRLARRTMIQNALGGWQYDVRLGGHYAPSGALWVTDTMVRVEDTRNNINKPLYITSVSRSLSANEGPSSQLTLWPPDLWLDDSDNPTEYTDDDFYEHVVPRVTW